MIRGGKIILVLLCLLLALHCLHGSEYARCGNILPDEIMDLKAYVSSCFEKIEQHLLSEERGEGEFLNLSKITKSRICNLFNLKRGFHFRFLDIFETKTRLFTLQHYNS